MNYFIITGASKGLGKALALKLLKFQQNYVFIISRTAPGIESPNCSFFSYDLAEVTGIPVLIDRIFKSIVSTVDAIYLINNAGTVTPIGSLDTCDLNEVVRNFNINAMAPAILSACFIKVVKRKEYEKGVISISTGAARTAYPGWAGYCSSKASLEMMSNCLALENQEFKIQTYDPGVIDTEMQAKLRSQNREDFPAVDKFISFKEDHKLLSEAEAAERLVARFFEKFTME